MARDTGRAVLRTGRADADRRPAARPWRQRFARAGIGASALLAVAGCSGGFFGGSSAGNAPQNVTRAPAPENAAAAVDTGGLLVYLDMMQDLIEGDALTRAAAFNDARDDNEFAPTTTNRLRYALALSVPGHTGSDPDAAAQRLRSLLAGTLEPGERLLATLQLHQAEQLQILADATADLRARLDAAVATRDAADAERLNRLIAENDELRKELENATTMLDAITSIERSISESEAQ